MELIDIIKKRMSIRAYKDRPLPRDVIESILEAAKHAPSARNMQELEYKVITSKELIKKLSDGIAGALKRQAPAMKAPPIRPNFFYEAPLLIIITAPRDNAWGASDAALAVQNIMLYATSIDLGSCFIGMARFIEKEQALLDELHITEDRHIAAAVICGYPDEKPEPKTKKMVAEFFE
jgi:nitroreductase